MLFAKKNMIQPHIIISTFILSVKSVALFFVLK